ncbi:MAG: hypothetical protein R8K20_09280, partial [Gallionellaceae bacterium]
MWRTEPPVIKEGVVEVGGMWATQAAAYKSKAFICAFVGGYGCLAANTKVLTEHGLLPISEINRPMRVASWNEETSQFQLSLTGGAFPRGAENLLEVTTTQG